MKADLLARYGKGQPLKLAELPDPVAAPGRVGTIAIQLAKHLGAIVYVDSSQARGKVVVTLDPVMSKA